VFGWCAVVEDEPGSVVDLVLVGSQVLDGVGVLSPLRFTRTLRTGLSKPECEDSLPAPCAAGRPHVLSVPSGRVPSTVAQNEVIWSSPVAVMRPFSADGCLCRLRGV
jgi:hypothetical protein